MENDNKMKAVIIGIVALVLVGGGIFWAMSRDSDDDMMTDQNASQQTDNDEMATAESDIVALASDTASLSTLVQAVTAADLVETLQGTGPFTVFAPSNDAFAKLPEGTVEDLLKPENKDQLTAILTYHVVSGKVMSSALSNSQEVETVQGDTLTVKIMDGKVYLVDTAGDEVMVTTADVNASNGVVHLIDGVLMPQS